LGAMEKISCQKTGYETSENVERTLAAGNTLLQEEKSLGASINYNLYPLLNMVNSAPEALTRLIDRQLSGNGLKLDRKRMSILPQAW